MSQVDWRDAAGREHYRTMPSKTEALTFLRQRVELGGIPMGEPTEAERWLVRDARRRGDKAVFSSLGAAKDFLTEELGKRKRGETSDPVGARRTLAEVFELQTASKPYAPATLDLRRAVWQKLEPELGSVRIGKIDTARIEALLADIAAPVMREKTRGLLALLFGYAMHPRRRWLSVSPVPRPQRDGTRAQRIERSSGSTKDRRHYLEDKELALLLAEIPERWRVMVEVMARMGLRPGEAYVLTVGKFTPATEVPELRPARLLIDTSLSGFTKTGEPRELTLPAVLAEKLTAHIEEYSDSKDPEAPMFPKEDGTAIDSKNGADAWRRRVFAPATIRAALGDGFTVNSLRHSAVSFAVAHQANVYDVQRMLGHAKPSITLDIYGSLWDDSAERLAERLDVAIRQSEVAPEAAGVISVGSRVSDWHDPSRSSIAGRSGPTGDPTPIGSTAER